MSTGNGCSPLRKALELDGFSLKDLTVLATHNDPFRVDTPARHRDGEWLAIQARELGLGNRKIHLRGLHYMVLGRPKPDGTPYTNTDEDWLWLAGDAGKAARWLGYIPFEQIIDQRNAAPVVRTFEPERPRAYIHVGIHVDIPDADELEPYVSVQGFTGAQPYKLVLIGEKASLGDVLAPVADRYAADLYLPTGEISDTLIYGLARDAIEDGRPMVVFYFADADPSGWQMPISVGRKLQACKVAFFPDLEFEEHRVCLTPDQVREYGLPSTPLKAKERRADRWRQAMGVQQTEIDAIASLRPDLLRQLARDAIEPYYDLTLDRRVRAARQEWREEAQAVIDAQIDHDHLEHIRGQAHAKLTELRDEIDAINDALRLDVHGFDLPELVVPTAQASGSNGTPLLDSRWSFPEQCQHLISSKAYVTDR